MKRIGVITSGGDAPGMNAALRAVVRTAIGRNVEVYAFHRGYRGMLEDDGYLMTSKDVGGIITQGGTILQSARSPKFREKEGRKQAYQCIKQNEVEGLVVIGGDGSLAGGLALQDEFDVPVLGVPASIDNDLSGTDYAIGFDTAINTALEAIDKIRDTAYSHDRVFVIEVMGRNNGSIALEVALASGAEAVLVPEIPYSLAEVCESLKAQRSKGKQSSILVVAEGAARAADVKKFVKENTGFETREIVLGHVQRGGSPTSFDRVLALQLGWHAANRLIGGYSREMVGLTSGRLTTHPLDYVLSTEVQLNAHKLELVEVMAQ